MAGPNFSPGRDCALPWILIGRTDPPWMSFKLTFDKEVFVCIFAWLDICGTFCELHCTLPLLPTDVPACKLAWPGIECGMLRPGVPSCPDCIAGLNLSDAWFDGCCVIWDEVAWPVEVLTVLATDWASPRDDDTGIWVGACRSWMPAFWWTWMFGLGVRAGATGLAGVWLIGLFLRPIVADDCGDAAMCIGAWCTKLFVPPDLGTLVEGCIALVGICSAVECSGTSDANTIGSLTPWGMSLSTISSNNCSIEPSSIGTSEVGIGCASGILAKGDEMLGRCCGNCTMPPCPNDCITLGAGCLGRASPELIRWLVIRALIPECPSDGKAADILLPVDAGGVRGGRSKFSDGNVGVGGVPERPSAWECINSCRISDIIGPSTGKTGSSSPGVLDIWKGNTKHGLASFCVCQVHLYKNTVKIYMNERPI